MDRKFHSERDKCSICLTSNDFRVLQCGHAFCFDCLRYIHEIEEGTILCPHDLKEDCTTPNSLPKPECFEGSILTPDVEVDSSTSIDKLLQDLVDQRMKTIKLLRRVASVLNGHELNSSISKISGSVAGVTGSVLAIVGLALSLSGVGAVAGVPLAISGASIGIAGGATTGITSVVEGVLKRNGIKEVSSELRLDRVKAIRLKVLCLRAAKDRALAERWNITSSQAFSVVRALPGAVKFGVTTAAGVKLAIAAGQAAARASLHITGIVFAAALIPIDLGQMIISSIRVHKKKPSDVINEIASMADDLEKQLRIYLIEEGYFNQIFTNDGHWAYIVINVLKLNEFNEGKDGGYNLKQLQEYGEVIESIKGRVVPTSLKEKMQNEWYSHYKEYKLQQSQDAESEDYLETDRKEIQWVYHATLIKTENISLQIPSRSVDVGVQLKISTIKLSKAPHIPCNFGEAILSDVVKVEPIGKKFWIPAVLSINHSAIEVPEHSSIVLKCFDRIKNEWVKLPKFEANSRQEEMKAVAEISIATLYVAVMSLNSNTHTVPAGGSSLSPFGKKSDVTIIFEECTFGDHDAQLEFKMNVFSEEAIRELNNLELKPILFLHMMSGIDEQFKKPITLKVPLKDELQSDEKIVVLSGSCNEVKNLTEVTSYKNEGDCLTVEVDKFSLLIIIQAKIGTMVNANIIDFFRCFAGPRFKVSFCIYCDDKPWNERSFHVGCCEEHRHKHMVNHMSKGGYTPSGISGAKLYSNTTMRFELSSCHQFRNEPGELTFANQAYRYTRKFSIKWNGSRAENSELSILKDGETPLESIPFDIEQQDIARRTGILRLDQIQLGSRGGGYRKLEN